jgi:hypothetical protein
MSTRMALMSTMEQRRERSKVDVAGNEDDLSDDETSLGFPQFWQVKQIPSRPR